MENIPASNCAPAAKRSGKAAPSETGASPLLSVRSAPRLASGLCVLTAGSTALRVVRAAGEVAVQLPAQPQACAWSASGECIVVGDAGGALHFVGAATGDVLLSQPLASSGVEFIRIVAPESSEQLLVLERSGRLHRFAGVDFGALRAAARDGDRDEMRRVKARIACVQSTVGDARSVPVDMQAAVRQHKLFTFVAASGSGAFAGITAWECALDAPQATPPRKVDAARPAQLGGEPVRLCLAGAQRQWLFVLTTTGVVTWWKLSTSSGKGVRLAKLGQWDGGALRADASCVAPTIVDFDCCPPAEGSGASDESGGVAPVAHLALKTRAPGRVYVVQVAAVRPERPVCLGAFHTLDSSAAAARPDDECTIAVSRDGGVHTVSAAADGGIAVKRVAESYAAAAAATHESGAAASDDVTMLRTHLRAQLQCAAAEQHDTARLEETLADLSALLAASAATRADMLLMLQVCKTVRPGPIDTVRSFVGVVRSVIDLDAQRGVGGKTRGGEASEQLPSALRDSVVAVLRRWSTFELLASLVTVSSAARAPALDGRYWTQFRDAPLRAVMAKILARGTIPWAQLVWRRHCEQAEGAELRTSIIGLLDHLPHSAAAATAATRWLRLDVVPQLSSNQLRRLAAWLDTRARELECECEDRAAALEVAGVLAEFDGASSPSASSAVSSSPEEEVAAACGALSAAPTPANEVRMSVRAMQVGAGGVEAKSELRKLFALHGALRDLAFLSAEMDVAMPLNSIEGVLPLRVAGRIFDQMCDELVEAHAADGDAEEAGAAAATTAAEEEEEPSAVAVASHVKRAMGRALRYCSRHALATDDVIGAYINEALSRVGFARSVALHRRVIATLYCIEAKQTRFAAALLVLRAARAPFGAEIDALLERCDSWATSTSQIETLREQQQLMDLHSVLARHSLDPEQFNVADSTSARLLLSHLLTRVEDDASLADGLIVAAAYDDLSAMAARATFLENLSTATPMEHNLDECVEERVARCTVLLAELEDDTERCAVARRVVNFCLSTLSECEASADDELRCQQRWAERVSVALAGAFLREIAASGSSGSALSEAEHLSERRADRALLDDVIVIRALQREFTVFLSVDSLSSDAQCERILNWVLRPFVCGAPAVAQAQAHAEGGNASGGSDGDERSVAAAEVEEGEEDGVLRRMDLRPLTSRTQLFRIGELLGVCRTSLQGELARQLALRGDVGAAVTWCGEVVRDETQRRTGDESASASQSRAALLTNALRDTSVALIEFVARESSSVFGRSDVEARSGSNCGAGGAASGSGGRGSPVGGSAASMQSRVPLFVRQLLTESVAACGDGELVAIVDLAAKADLVAAVFSECELGEYNCLWEDQSSSLHEPKVPSRLAHYRVWYRDAALVLETRRAMQLAFAYCFAPPRLLLKSGEALVRHLQENGFEQLALRVLGHCFSLSISQLSAESKSSADGLTARIFCSMLTKALASQHTVDIDLSLSCMLSMPRKEAKNAYHKALLVGSIHKGKHRDFARLESLGHLGRRLGGAWKDEQRRGKGEALARHARWWHRLTELDIKFNHLAWWETWQKLGQSATFAKNVLPELLQKSGNNLAMAQSFAAAFQIAQSDPLLLFVEALAQEPGACVDPARRGAIEAAIQDILSAERDIASACHSLDFLLERLLSKIEGCDYESLLFLRTMQARARACIVEQLDTKRHAKSRAEAKERCAFSRRHALVLRILLQWWGNTQSSGGSSSSGRSRSRSRSRESRACKGGSTGNVAAFSYHTLFSLPDPASRGAASREGGRGLDVLSFSSPSSAAAVNWEVLKAALTVENVRHLIPLHAPLLLDPDQFYACLLDRMIPTTSLGSAEGVSKALASTVRTVCDLLRRIKGTRTAIRTAKQLAKSWPKDTSKIFLLEEMAATCAQWAGDDGAEGASDQAHDEVRAQLLASLNDAKDELCLSECFGAAHALAMMTAPAPIEEAMGDAARPKEIVRQIYLAYAADLDSESAPSPTETQSRVHTRLDVHAVAAEFGSRHHFDVERIEQMIAHNWLAHGYVRASSAADVETSPGPTGGSSSSSSSGEGASPAAEAVEVGSIFAPTPPERAARAEARTVRCIVFVLSATTRRKNHCVMLMQYALEENVKRTYAARVRALRAAFKLVDFATLELAVTRVRKSLVRSMQQQERSEEAGGEAAGSGSVRLSALAEPDFLIVEHWQYCMYMEELQALRIPLTMHQLKNCDKTGLMRSIWKDHHDDRRGIRLLSTFMLDFESQSLELWAAVLGQMKRMNMQRELVSLLKGLSHFKCFACIGSQGNAVRGFAETWVHAIEAPLRALLAAPQDGSAVTAVLHGVASVIESCPFVEQLELSGLRCCARKLLERDELHGAARRAVETLGALCAVADGAFERSTSGK